MSFYRFYQITKSVLILLLVFLAFYQSADAQADQRIIGSKPATQKYPWVAALVEKKENSYWGQFCGGSLIASRWVLTAAHCLENMGARQIDVVLGRPNLKKRNGERISVGKIIKSGETIHGSSDLALLYLTRPSKITPVEIAEKGPWIAGQGEVLGWGAKRTYFPSRLQKGTVDFLPFSSCDQAYDWEYSIDLAYCAGKENGKTDSCWRDGGGPLLFAGKLLSVISWKWQCGQSDLPGVYARILPFQEWIDYNIANPPIDYLRIKPGRDHKKKPKPYVEIFLISITSEEIASWDNQHVVAVGSNYPIRSSRVLLSGRNKRTSTFCFADRPRCINGKTWFKQTLGLGRQQAVTEFSHSNIACANIKSIVHIKHKKKPRWRWKEESCLRKNGFMRIRLG